MCRFIIVAPGLMLIVGLLVSLALAGRTPTQAQSPASNVRVTQVDASNFPDTTLYVAALDQAGQPRGGLQQDDFAITEDGTPVGITGFTGAGNVALNTALIIDRSASMDESGKLAGAQAAANAYVDAMRPGDTAALIAFDSSIDTLQRFTGDTDELHAAVERIDADGGTALYDSVVAGVDALDALAGRRVLVVLTDGEDCREPNSCPTEYGSSHSLDDAIAYANQHQQPVYVVGLGQRGGGEDAGVNEPVLQRIVSETEGDYFYAPSASELADLYTRLAGSLQAEYQLSYRSPRPFYDGTRRDIQVLVGGEGAAGGYTERHLINVRSGSLVGVALLTPLVLLLLLPLTQRHKWKRLEPEDEPTPVEPAPATTPPEALPQSSNVPGFLPPASATLVAETMRRCVACQRPLRAQSLFCSSCGTRQPEPQSAAQQVFCDQCGGPLMAGAKFCMECGAIAPERQEARS